MSVEIREQHYIDPRTKQKKSFNVRSISKLVQINKETGAIKAAVPKEFTEPKTIRSVNKLKE